VEGVSGSGVGDSGGVSVEWNSVARKGEWSMGKRDWRGAPARTGLGPTREHPGRRVDPPDYHAGHPPVSIRDP
jgi:hypothetical protein